MQSPLIYVVRADLTEGFEHDHHLWYQRKHAPDVLGVGFESARAYYNDGGFPRMWNHYEIKDLSVLKTKEYGEMHAGDPYLPTVLANLIGRSVSMYSQVQVVDPNGKQFATVRSLRGPRLITARFDTSVDAAEVGIWFSDKFVPSAGQTSGLIALRLWQQQLSHPKWETTEPHWCVALEGKLGFAVNDDLERVRMLFEHFPVSNLKTDSVYKRYGLVREDILDAEYFG